MLEIGLPPRLRMCGSFLEYLYPELLPASPGAQLQGTTVCTFSIQLVQIRLQPPIGSKTSEITFFDSMDDCCNGI